MNTWFKINMVDEQIILHLLSNKSWTVYHAILNGINSTSWTLNENKDGLYFINFNKVQLVEQRQSPWFICNLLTQQAAK